MLFSFFVIGSQPRFCSGGLCPLVLPQGFFGGGNCQRDESNRFERPAKSKDENPRQHMGRDLGECQGYTCTSPEEAF